MAVAIAGKYMRQGDLVQSDSLQSMRSWVRGWSPLKHCHGLEDSREFGIKHGSMQAGSNSSIEVGLPLRCLHCSVIARGQGMLAAPCALTAAGCAAPQVIMTKSYLGITFILLNRSYNTVSQTITIQNSPQTALYWGSFTTGQQWVFGVRRYHSIDKFTVCRLPNV